MSSEGEIVVGYEFDRDAVWAKVNGRKAVYLDMMVWIAMADDKPEGHAIKDKLREHVRAGTVFCPLTQSLLWELSKQDFSKMRTGALMEELSLNVCFSRKQDVFAWEIESLAKRLANREDERSSPKMLFTSIIGHVAPDVTLTYHSSVCESVVQDSAKKIFHHLDAMGLTELLRLEEQGKMESYFKTMQPPAYQAQAKYYKKHLGGDRSKVRTMEEQAVVNSYLMPVLEKLADDLVPGLAQFFDPVPKDKYGGKLSALLAECPAIHNHIEAMTRNSEDHNRKDRVNDFFDLEMMAVPLAYADVFVTLDKWVRVRFLEPGGFLKRSRSNCQFCPTVSELENWLDSF